MRVFGVAVVSLLFSALSASAQGAGQPAENLDTVLRGWEKAMTELKSFVAVVERTTQDKALNAKDEHKGYAMFLKASLKDDASRARLELAKVSNTKIYEKYICTGPLLYEYVPANTLVRVHNMPQNKNDKQQESFLSFLFGMGAEQAKARYQMTHVQPNPSDKHYHYILVKPKLDQDKSDFLEARLSLFRANNLPAQIWYLQPNKNEITWNFKDIQMNVQIPLTYFQPEYPKDWKVEQVRPKAQPVSGQPAAKAPTIRN